MGIFNAVILAFFLSMYEGTKYVPAFSGKAGATIGEDDPAIGIREDGLVKFDWMPAANGIDQARSHHVLDSTIPQNS
ncbi:Major facilitator superfamily domain general substrate transporter [Penicillium verrucosum]|uniref:Major facilitator superfamily domain general substrate transporter n=1 Tax=Penicillium verrucosum TaxID=60171 RepID=UPI0025459FE8|nr:Major facilitator superfamily domain general substrate transporter [Penicillium verrucosum]KAJ5920422.1 Major facilitator superfamily domain general substrate transporter [Penicillium verrucosum]